MRAVISRSAVASAAVAAVLAAWLVAASYLFVALGRVDIDQPWLAWWLYATHQPDLWTRCLLAVSAITPALATCAALIALWRAVGARLRRPLYGNSAWATNAEMRAGGIRSSRAFF
jgi:type IV secretory pathway TraG/TraD family ATPase VirD4